MKPEIKKIIDGMNYESMLRRCRFPKVEHPMFQGDTRDHFLIVLTKKREKIDNDAHVGISKVIGWSN